MRVGVGSYAYRWSIGLGDVRPARPLTPLQLLQRVAALGGGVVQYADNMPLLGLPARDADALRAASRDRDVEIEIGTHGAGMDHLVRHGDLAQRLGARLLRVTLSADDLAAERDELRDRLRGVGDAFASWGGVIAIENHFLMGSAGLAALVASVDHPAVGVCLDVANSIANQEWPAETVRTLAPYAANLHIKDFEFELDPHGVGLRVVGAPLGTGRVGVPWVLDALAEAGRDVNVIVEHWIAREAFDAGGIELEDTWTRQALAAVRSAIADRDAATVAGMGRG